MARIKIIEKLSYLQKIGKTVKILPFESPGNASLIDLSSFSSTSVQFHLFVNFDEEYLQVS